MESVSVALAKSNMSEETQIAIKQMFEPFEAQAKEWSDKVDQIKVADVTDVKGMQEAKTARLALRKIRTDVEKKHKEMKEESLRKGRFIDLIKNSLVGLIKPLEEKCEEKEKFIENLEAQRKAEIRNKRLAEIAPYRVPNDGMDNLPLAEMADIAFDNLVRGMKAAHEQREFEKAELEKIRARQEDDAKNERERIKAENERLKKEAEERGQEARRIQALWRNRLSELSDIKWNGQEALYNDSVVISYDALISINDQMFQEVLIAHNARVRTDKAAEKERQDRIDQERKEAAEKERKAREATEAKLKKETEERKRLEREAQERAEQEEVARKQKAADERRARRAPDKEKLLALAERISLIDQPQLKEDDAKEILLNVQAMLAKVQSYIKKQCENL